MDKRLIIGHNSLDEIMNRTKFSDLLEYEDKVVSIYADCGLRINVTSRIFQYFTFLRRIETERKKGSGEFNTFFEKDKARNYFGLYHVSELKDIVDALEKTTQDINIVRAKLVDLANGTYLLSEENPEDRKSRNTTFELSLFSFLHKLGTNVSLGEPNPDLRVSTPKFNYNIECKRPASADTVARNIKRALKQLRKPSLPAGVPTIAISLDKILMNDDLILDSFNEQTSMEKLDQILMSYAQVNKRQLDNICGSEPCVVLYYLSCLVGFQTKDIPLARATYMIGNVYNFESNLSQNIYTDLKMFTVPDNQTH